MMMITIINPNYVRHSQSSSSYQVSIPLRLTLQHACSPEHLKDITDLLLLPSSACLIAGSPNQKNNLKSKLSQVIGDNLARQLNQRQTGQPTHHQRPCTTKNHILKDPKPVSHKKHLVLVSFPVLIQIKPQAPPLVCPSVNSFKFQPCGRSSPRAQEL